MAPFAVHFVVYDGGPLTHGVKDDLDAGEFFADEDLPNVVFPICVDWLI